MKLKAKFAFSTMAELNLSQATLTTADVRNPAATYFRHGFRAVDHSPPLRHYNGSYCASGINFLVVFPIVGVYGTLEKTHRSVVVPQ